MPLSQYQEIEELRSDLTSLDIFLSHSEGEFNAFYQIVTDKSSHTSHTNTWKLESSHYIWLINEGNDRNLTETYIMTHLCARSSYQSKPKSSFAKRTWKSFLKGIFSQAGDVQPLQRSPARSMASCSIMLLMVAWHGWVGLIRDNIIAIKHLWPWTCLFFFFFSFCSQPWLSSLCC